MDTNVHPAAAAAAILVMLLGIGVWAWANGHVAGLTGPTLLLASPDGRLYVQIQDELLEHDATGRFARRVDLGALEVSEAVGAMAFTADGGLLVRRGPALGHLDYLRAFFRMRNSRSVADADPGAGLHRCDLETQECERFGPAPVDPRAAFGLALDTTSGSVFLSDTSRHALRKFAADGTPEANAERGFKFPNGIVFHEGRLFVADTNHHRVVEVDPASDTFGREVGAHDVVPPEARSRSQRWPAVLAHIGERWWVINMTGGMGDGGIYLFDADWRFERRVGLPAEADPVAILAFADEVLVSDPANDRIHRVSREGEVLGEFVSNGLSQALSETRRMRAEWRTWAYGGGVVMVLPFVAVFVALMKTGRGRAETPARKARSVPGPGGDVVWVARDRRTMRTLRVASWTMGACSLGLVALGGFSCVRLGLAESTTLVASVAGLIAVGALMIWIMRANARTAIGVSDGVVTIRDHRGRETSCHPSDLTFDGTTVASPEGAVFLGQPALPLFDRQSLMTHLYPLLGEARSVTPVQMQSRLISVRHPNGVALVIALTGIVLMAVVTMLREVL